MKLCLYLSPWDMHEKTYGTKLYNDYYIHQLEELLTNYGPVYLLWFDGAGTASEVSGVKMPFDWERIFSKARELQSDVLLSGNAPDIRWVGNEKGKGRETEWSVQGINDTETLFGALTGYNPTLSDLGSINDLMKKKRLVWYPSRGGLPLRKGWFYNKRDDNDIKSLKYLVDSYFETIGFRKMLRLSNPVTADKFRIRFTDARVSISWGNLSMYYLEQVPDEEESLKKRHTVAPSNIQISVYEIASRSGSAKALVSGNRDTCWKGQAEKLPAAFIFRLKNPSDLSGFSYFPAENGEGHIENYAIFVSVDGVNWGKPVASGRFGNITNNPVEQVIAFSADKVLYLKFEVLGTTSKTHTFTIADFQLLEK